MFRTYVIVNAEKALSFVQEVEEKITKKKSFTLNIWVKRWGEIQAPQDCVRVYEN
jgi:hypothetical protein